jgi:hypothetical protein
MKPLKVTVSIALATVLAFSVLSFAEETHHNAEGATPAVQPPVPETAFATNAKVAYFYSRGFGPARSKNVSEFSNPSTGIYCVLPSVSVNVEKDYPLVSIEWGYSAGAALMAYWIDVSAYTNCPSGYLEVITYDFNAGGYPVLSSNVAWDLVIE